MHAHEQATYGNLSQALTRPNSVLLLPREGSPPCDHSALAVFWYLWATPTLLFFRLQEVATTGFVLAIASYVSLLGPILQHVVSTVQTCSSKPHTNRSSIDTDGHYKKYDFQWCYVFVINMVFYVIKWLLWRYDDEKNKHHRKCVTKYLLWRFN